jgi:iron(III) transport system permease protein
MGAVARSEAAVALPRRLAPAFDGKWPLVGLCVALTAFLGIVPLAFLLWQSFLTPQSAEQAARFTFENYRSAFAGADTLTLFWNSLRFAGGSSLFAFTSGAALAWLNERTNTPFKSLFYGLSVIPLIIPGVLFTVAWILLASPKIGLLNLVLESALGTTQPPLNIYSLTGMAFVDGLHYSPMAFLLMSAAFRSMDPSLEESALMSGASVFQVLRKVTLKLAWPAVFATLLILFVRALESFEVPALLGLPVSIQVFTSAIYQAVHHYPSEIGLASSYGAALLALTSAGIYFQSRLSAMGSKYATLTGKGFRPRRIDLGAWRHAAAALFILYFLLIVVLPLAVLLWSSLQKYYSVPTVAALSHLSLDAYRYILSYPALPGAVWNSLLLAATTATLVMAVSSVVAWIVVKSRLRGRWLLDNIASLPMVFPGIVLGLAIMVFYLNVDIGIYGTLWILLVAYVTRFIPYGMRYNSAALLQIHRELEESAAMSGASWATTFRRVVLPLIAPGLLAGWIYILIVSIRELSTSILLYGPDSEVLSTLVWELWDNGQYVELSALGVLFVAALLILVLLAQRIGRTIGLREP